MDSAPALRSPLYAKIHEKSVGQSRSVVIALCDRELLGRVLEDGAHALDLKKYAAFYKGEAVDEARAAELLAEFNRGAPGRNPANYNLVGEKSLAAARKVLRVNDASVKRICGVPHLQIYRV